MILAMENKRAPLLKDSLDLRSQALHAMERKLAVDVQHLLVKISATILLNAAKLQTALVDAANKSSSIS